MKNSSQASRALATVILAGCLGFGCGGGDAPQQPAGSTGSAQGGQTPPAQQPSSQVPPPSQQPTSTPDNPDNVADPKAGNAAANPNPDPVTDPATGDTTAPPKSEDKKETAADYPNLKIETLKEGEGDVLEYGKRVKCHYTGTLASGEVFDSSRFNARGEKDERDYTVPAELTIATPGVIKGWSLGMPGMKVGEVRRLTIPADLAYGTAGSGGAVPPNSVLVFEVELVEILQ